MNDRSHLKPFLYVRLEWLVEPLENDTAWLSAYHENDRECGLFSVLVKFVATDPETGKWQFARVFAIVGDMEERLLSGSGPLIITAGMDPIIIGRILSSGEDDF